MTLSNQSISRAPPLPGVVSNGLAFTPLGGRHHHFKSKTELAYAVLDEEIRHLLEPVWIAPLQDIDKSGKRIAAIACKPAGQESVGDA